MSAKRSPYLDGEAGGVDALMRGIGEAARQAAAVLGTASAEAKDNALRAAADALRKREAEVLDANRADIWMISRIKIP